LTAKDAKERAKVAKKIGGVDRNGAVRDSLPIPGLRRLMYIDKLQI
jgi:hypothetical protein